MEQSDFGRDLHRAVEQIVSQPAHPCRLGQHVVTRGERRRGYGVCKNCGAPVGKRPIKEASDG